MKSGTVSTENFTSQIPFHRLKEIPFVYVKIAGKEYRFMFDSGAPCVISTELYEQLGLKKTTASKITDSGGLKAKQIYTTIDKIELGDVEFQNIGTVVMNLNTSEIFQCLDFDGIIGANLMRTAIWEMDYQKNILTFSNDLKNLNTAGEKHVLNFSPVLSGTPHLDIIVDSITIKDVTFDTGSSGYLTLPAKTFKGQYLNTNSHHMGYGVSSYGVYGAGQVDTSFTVKTKNISLGTVTETDKIIELEKINKEILGNLFFENYRVIMDWTREQISLYPVIDNRGKNENKNTFGYSLAFANQKITVDYIYIDSPADKAGLNVGDEIIEISGQKTTDLTADQRCDLWYKSYKDLDEITLLILRGDEEVVLNLEKVSLF